jgi:hypothetical protein
MTVITFGAMCRYDDASGLRWRNIRFVEDGSGFEITFEKKKNAQYWQGNKVVMATCPDAVVCAMRLLLQLRAFTGGAEDLHVFRGFNGRLNAKNPGRTAPGPDKIMYDHMLRFMGLWFSGVLGTSVAPFKISGPRSPSGAGVLPRLLTPAYRWSSRASTGIGIP